MEGRKRKLTAKAVWAAEQAAKQPRAATSVTSTQRRITSPIESSDEEPEHLKVPDKRPRIDVDADEENSESSSEHPDQEPEDEDAELGKPTQPAPHVKNAYLGVERMKKEMTAPSYAFFHQDIDIIHVDGRRVHVFTCAKPGCKRVVKRYLDKTDAMSTGNLRKHVKSCWGPEALDAADAFGHVKDARESVEKLGRTGLLTEAFKCMPGSKKTYSTRQHTPMQSRFVYMLPTKQY